MSIATPPACPTAESFLQADAASMPVSAAPSCMLCGSAARPWLTLAGDWRKPQVPQPFQLYWCDDCRYGSVVPRPSLADLAAAYDVDDYYTHHAPRRANTARPLFERLRRSLAWLADRHREGELAAASMARYGIRPPARLCDIGCGNGGLLKRMASAGFDVVGLEPDGDVCRSATTGEIPVVPGSAEAIPAELAAEHFDVVTMMHVLEHTLDPIAAVGNIAELLSPGGTFIVETPNHACLGARAAGSSWRWLDVPRHLNFFTPRSLRAICEQAGLEVLDVEYTGYVRQFDDDWIADEQEIHRRLAAFGNDHATPLAPRNGARRALRLLARTCLANDEAKYDSVRVVARK